MSSVGPQLPPHLMKRKRSIDDDDAPNSPPHKLQAAEEPQPRRAGPTLPPSTAEGEISLSSDEEDDYGPSLGPQRPSKPTSSSAKQAVGPLLPPKNTTATATPAEGEIALSSDEEDDYGPSILPSAAAPTGPKRVLGPAPPPANLAERPSTAAAADSESSDDDDDYGPSLPPAPGSAAETRMLEQRASEAALKASSTHSTARPQRDDWMLVPPSDSDWSSRVDPTKLKSRKFASGKGSKAPTEKSGISAIWTETPEEKRQRLEDEVLGRKDAATSSRQAPEKAGAGLDREERATERRIREYNEKNRSKSLYDEHKKQTPKEKEDDPSKRGFDKEKDMGLGGRIGHVQKKDMIGRAADFGSRFQKGKYL